SENTDWHIALRVLCFLSCSRYGVESDISEEHNGSRPDDSTETEFTKCTVVRRDIRCVVVGVDVCPAEDDKYQNNADFESNDYRIRQSRLAGSLDQDE